jgi:hypothetical protein
MSEIEFPPDLVDLQRRSHGAWDAVEAHRKTVDADRRAGAVVETDPTRRWESPVLREWTAEEHAEHDRLMGIVTEAAEALRAGLAGSGLGTGYDTVQALHKAAREA